MDTIYTCRTCGHTLTIKPGELTTANVKTHCGLVMTVKHQEAEEEGMALEEQIKWCHRNNMVVEFQNPNGVLYRIKGWRHWHRAYDLKDAVKYAQQLLEYKAERDARKYDRLSN